MVAVLIVLFVGVLPSVSADDPGQSGAPAAPLAVQVVTTTPVLTVTWTYPADGAPVVGFNVYAVDTDGNIRPVGSTTGVVYAQASSGDSNANYFVVAYNGLGEGPAKDSSANFPFKCDPIHTHVYNATGGGPIEYHAHVHTNCLPG